MEITLTGASGFVGKNLSQYLTEKGKTVISLSLRGDWQTQWNDQANAVIHLAGKAHDLENSSEEAEYFKVNRGLTIELFEKFLKSEARDFFYFSSVKAAADSVDGVLTEDIVPNPLTPYGKSKIEAEKHLLSQTLPSNKRLFIIRPCMIHSPGNKGNLNLLFNLVEKGIPWQLSNFENNRSFVSVDNVSFLINEMLEDATVPSGIYNFADDHPLSTNDLIKSINNALGKKPKFLPVPRVLIQGVAKVGDTINFPLNSERLKKLTESYVVSNEKIKTALGIKTLPLSAEENLIKTIKSFADR